MAWKTLKEKDDGWPHIRHLDIVHNERLKGHATYNQFGPTATNQVFQWIPFFGNLLLFSFWVFGLLVSSGQKRSKFHSKSSLIIYTKQNCLLRPCLVQDTKSKKLLWIFLPLIKQVAINGTENTITPPVMICKFFPWINLSKAFSLSVCFSLLHFLWSY